MLASPKNTETTGIILQHLQRFTLRTGSRFLMSFTLATSLRRSPYSRVMLVSKPWPRRQWRQMSCKFTHVAKRLSRIHANSWTFKGWWLFLVLQCTSFMFFPQQLFPRDASWTVRCARPYPRWDPATRRGDRPTGRSPGKPRATYGESDGNG